jgi:hypothetical protein
MTGSTRGAGAKRGLLRLSIAAVACCGLSTACARTSDGSVVLARPLTFPRFFSRQAPAPHYTAAPAQHLALAERRAPAKASAPAAVTTSGASDVQLWKPSVKAPFERTDPSRPLSCHNETLKSGRVRMVCR